MKIISHWHTRQVLQRGSECFHGAHIPTGTILTLIFDNEPAPKKDALNLSNQFDHSQHMVKMPESIIISFL